MSSIDITRNIEHHEQTLLRTNLNQFLFEIFVYCVRPNTTQHPMCALIRGFPSAAKSSLQIIGSDLSLSVPTLTTPNQPTPSVFLQEHINTHADK